MKFVSNFQSPVTVMAYDIISFHHDIMFFIFIMLSLVYWSLYKMVKDGNCFSFSEQVGFFSLVYNTNMFFYVEAYIMFLWMSTFFWSMLVLVKFFDYLEGMYLMNNMSSKSFFSKPNFFFMHLNHLLYSGADDSLSILFFSLDEVKDYLSDKYVSYKLFSTSNYGSFYYDSLESPLLMERFKHSTTAEYVFAAFPTFMMLCLLLPSLFLLYSLDDKVNPWVTVIVTGHQWYWSFAFVGECDYSFEDRGFDMILKSEEELVWFEKSLLSTDTAMALYKYFPYRFLVTSADVLHSFALPSLGVKVDAMPGSLNQFIIIPRTTGIFYGQCSEMCGTGHGFMPMTMVVEDFLKSSEAFLTNEAGSCKVQLSDE